MKSAIECHLESSAPNDAEIFLRIGIRDVPSDQFGVTEVRTVSVRRLAPPLYPISITSNEPLCE